MDPLFVTFDTNTYSPVARPQLDKIVTTGWPLTAARILSKGRRVAAWYVSWCICRGRIRAGIAEAALAAEAMQNTDRIELLVATGTPRFRELPPVPEGRKAIVQDALKVGFRAMHTPRIGYGEMIGILRGQWALDERFSAKERQDRMSRFIRHFDDYPKERLRDLGEQLSAAHKLAVGDAEAAAAAAMWSAVPGSKPVSADRILWRKALARERENPKQFASREMFEKHVRHLFADWADFDIAAAHFAYGYDYLCTEDQGSARSDSIFGPQYASASSTFGLATISLMDLAALCWKRFGFPITTWPTQVAAAAALAD